MKMLNNKLIFAFLYILFMIPTYILPYFGSNSALVNAASEAVTHHMSFPFYLHLISLLLLIILAFGRASHIEKKWIVIFPILASIFDIVPGFDIVPLVPTIMHLIIIIMGVSAITPSNKITQTSIKLNPQN